MKNKNVDLQHFIIFKLGTIKIVRSLKTTRSLYQNQMTKQKKTTN